MEEIEVVEGFKEKQPIRKDNYAKILGHYNFEFDVECCLEKENGKLCRKEHQFGFVVKLQDSSVSILGNVCAKNHFDADTNIRKDISAYNNAKRRRERFDRFYSLLSCKEQSLETIEVLQKRLKVGEERVSDFNSTLCREISQILAIRAKTRVASVNVTFTRYVEGEDEDGEPYTEKRSFPEKLGDLSSTRVFGDHYFSAAFHKLNKIKRAFISASQVNQDTKTSIIEKLASEMSEIESVEDFVNGVDEDIVSFFNNDLALLCYLHSNNGVRFKTARVVLQQIDPDCGKNKAKDWLIKRDKQLKESRGVDKLEIR